MMELLKYIFSEWYIFGGVIVLILVVFEGIEGCVRALRKP